MRTLPGEVLNWDDRHGLAFSLIVEWDCFWNGATALRFLHPERIVRAPISKEYAAGGKVPLDFVTYFQIMGCAASGRVPSRLQSKAAHISCLFGTVQLASFGLLPN
jgi:hypothetical protein